METYLRTELVLKALNNEYTVCVRRIVAERCAFHEAMAPIEGACKLKIIPGAGLEAETRHAACTCSCNYVAQHRASRSPSAYGLSGMHRLDLAMILGEPPERTDTHEGFIVPDRPKADVGGLQPA